MPFDFPEPNPIQPVPYNQKSARKRLCVFDTETDPFEYNVIVQPFTCGFYDGAIYKDFWGDDCIEQFFGYLAEYEEELLIYVHNGGNFDFHFMLDYIDRGSAPFIINGRLAKLMMQGQEFRDSYSLIPVALSAATKGAKQSKIEFDYDKMKREVREQHREEILHYQKLDCLSLYDLVREAQVMFGDKLTMASVALPMLNSHHGFEKMSERIDADIRPYYYGGRNQCFELGELEGDWKIYDVNSMYPFVMAKNKHPVSATPFYENDITERTHFARIVANSDGALPLRMEDGSLAFPRGEGEFFATMHEIQAGLDTGTLQIKRVIESIYFEDQTSFSDFVEHFYKMRLEADANGDQIRKLYYKLVLNSSYGKLAQDPRKYENYLFDPQEMPKPLKCAECTTELDVHELCKECRRGNTSPYGWYPHTMRPNEIIYARPAQRLSRFGFYNVATAASITGAARAYLLRGISQAERPIYCDTDSIICTNLAMPLHNTELGAWKLEATGDVAYIAGKKLYAVCNRGEPVKQASKGVKLTATEIAAVCRGETVEYSHPVPKFQLDGSKPEFIKRKIQRTGVLQ